MDTVVKEAQMNTRIVMSRLRSGRSHTLGIISHDGK
jgi:hypothetical protein